MRGENLRHENAGGTREANPGHCPNCNCAYAFGVDLCLLELGCDRVRELPSLRCQLTILSLHFTFALRRKSLSDTGAILDRSEKGFDHFCALVIASELIHLLQPEIIASVVGIRPVVWIALQVTEVLSQHERAIE